ncbi:DUF4252 domain-containing protein [Proteiniphilum sp. X52]|uniref:DUF4252 domain-containing protein n=1 Tax=Proteiniphilum sp. X52 TaxID=2382159 RepID=UPI000F09C88C|nr:DUF4252 domain-containing protein [Proteiniphilum sp. X52]RNC63945.1 DUF4252 domain-containing protein [Proteiniphilum sp. X52]
MKRILSILFLATAFVAGASAQQLEKLFDKYMEDERFNYVYQKKASTYDRLSDMGGNVDIMMFDRSKASLGRQMLTLNSADKSLQESFTREVDNALKADKYEQVSIVRNGKNRVESYEKVTPKSTAKVSFIKNPGNIVVTLNLYAPKK